MRKKSVTSVVAGLCCGGAVLGLALFFGACGPSRPKPQDYSEVMDTDTVTMLDSKVTTQLSRQKEWTEHVNGFLKVHLVLRNLGGKNLKIEAKTDFRDESDASIEHPNLTWEPITINPHEDYHYSKLCPVIGGTQYHVYVRIGTDDHN